MKLRYLFIPIIVVTLLALLELILHPIPEDKNHHYVTITAAQVVPQSPFMLAVSITLMASFLIGFGLVLLALLGKKDGGKPSQINTRHLWLIYTGSGLVSISLLFAAIAQGMWPSLLFVLVNFSVVFFWLRYKGSRVGSLLQSTSPEDLINAFFRHKSWLTKGMNTAAAPIHSRAFVYLLYGQYDSVRRELATINWNERLPAVQGLGILIEALLCYFDTKNYEEGLRLAYQAKELLRVEGPAPGKANAEAHEDFYIELGEILCGRATLGKDSEFGNQVSEIPDSSSDSCGLGSGAGLSPNEPARKVSRNATIPATDGSPLLRSPSIGRIARSH